MLMEANIPINSQIQLLKQYTCSYNFHPLMLTFVNTVRYVIANADSDSVFIEFNNT